MRTRQLQVRLFAGAVASLFFFGALTVSAATADESDVAIRERTLRDFAADLTATPPGTKIAVEVHGPDLQAVMDAIWLHGGEPYGVVPGFFIEAHVPAEQMTALELEPAVQRIATLTKQLPGGNDTQQFQTGTQLTHTIENTLGLGAWHDAGYRGEGQKIGILDIFGRTEFEEASTAGRIPAPSGTFCLSLGSPCSLLQSSPAAHGIGVAEIIHRTAPDAELYFASVTTTSDLAAAIDWFAAQGVTVINRSETSQFDGPGDGTGPVGSLVDQAIAAGMNWVAAAGNAGGDSFNDGQNFLSEFNDPDGNGIHNFATGSERMPFQCGFLLGMRWDDWSADSVATDYDIGIFDTPTALRPEATGATQQVKAFDPPIEHINPSCNRTNDIDYIQIAKFADLEPDGPDLIQIMGNFTGMSEWNNERSATGPGADSANPGAITVGALATPGSTQIAFYSSQGPTSDGRMVPHLVAPSCLIVTNFPGCFTGTSSSTPIVTGLIAVLRDAGLIGQPSDVSSLLSVLTVDHGAPGIDPVYGHGALRVPLPASLGVIDRSELCMNLVPTIVGTDGDDTIEGTEGPDVIVAGDGNDLIFGLGGADVICGGAGQDRIYGGGASDTIDGGPQRDQIWGQSGRDVILGGTGPDRLVGGAGADELRGQGGNDRVSGRSGPDILRGGAGNDRIDGGSQADSINGGSGNDRCQGRSLSSTEQDVGDSVTRCEL